MNVSINRVVVYIVTLHIVEKAVIVTTVSNIKILISFELTLVIVKYTLLGSRRRFSSDYHIGA